LHVTLAIPNSFGFAQHRLHVLQENLGIAWHFKTHVLSLTNSAHIAELQRYIVVVLFFASVLVCAYNCGQTPAYPSCDWGTPLIAILYFPNVFLRI
jgi:hypothetical protein